MSNFGHTGFYKRTFRYGGYGVKLFTAVDFPTLAKGAPNTDTFYSSELLVFSMSVGSCAAYTVPLSLV